MELVKLNPAGDFRSIRQGGPGGVTMVLQWVKKTATAAKAEKVATIVLRAIQLPAQKDPDKRHQEARLDVEQNGPCLSRRRQFFEKSLEVESKEMVDQAKDSLLVLLRKHKDDRDQQEDCGQRWRQEKFLKCVL